MGINFLKYLRRPLSVSSYAFLFIGLSIAAYSILGWIGLEQMNRFQQEAEQANRAAAAEESSNTFSLIAANINRIAMGLAAWDEMHQEHPSPASYLQRENTLLPNSGLLPKYIKSIEIHGPKDPHREQEAANRRPAGIEINRPGLYLISNPPDLDLVAFLPTNQSAAKNSSNRYIELRADFMAAFREINRFYFLDESSITLSLPANRQIPLEEAAGLIQYHLKRSTENEALRQIMSSTLYRLVIVITLLYAIFYISGLFLFGRPLQHLSKHIDSLKNGSGSRIIKKYPSAVPVIELEKVHQSLNEYQLQLEEAQDNLEAMNEELRDQTRHDALTNLLNRRAFDEDWRNVRNITSEQRFRVSFLLFDCDHFKAINDSYGHQTGDEVIKAIAGCLIKGLRKGDRIYRLGGDEFAAVLINCEKKQAKNTADRCLKQLNQFDFSQFDIMEPVRVSAGLACAKGTDLHELNALPWRADVAMYHAKRPGVGQVATYSKKMAATSESLFSNWTTSAVYQAITSGKGLEMHYQPIVCLSSETPQYYEALVRIRTEDTLVPPSSIFPIVEAKRLEIELDLATIKRIQQDLWAGKLPKSTGVSINVSGPMIIRPDVIEALKGFTPFMSDYKCVLEITETALITHLKQATKNLKKIQEMGFMIALDDFGSGYSSMQYLANMPVDIVKFDISMIRCLEKDERHRIIVESLAQMITSAGYQMVAEGIETDEMSQLVAEIGFQFGQGYYFGRPSPQVQQLQKTAG